MTLSRAEQARLYEESMMQRERVPVREFFGGAAGEMPSSREPGRPHGGSSGRISAGDCAEATGGPTEERAITRPARELAHAGDPGTAREAAGSNALGKNTNRRVCLEKHAAAIAGLSDDECAARTGLELIEARRRCSDLRTLGLIEWMVMDHGTEEKPDVKAVRRPTALGKESTVSRITDAGRAALSAGAPS